MSKKGKRAFEGAKRDITYPIKSVRRDWPDKINDSFHGGINHGVYGTAIGLEGIIDHPFTVTTTEGKKMYCVETYNRLDSKALEEISEHCKSHGFDYEINQRFCHWNPDGCICIAFSKIQGGAVVDRKALSSIAERSRSEANRLKCGSISFPAIMGPHVILNILADLAEALAADETKVEPVAESFDRVGAKPPIKPMNRYDPKENYPGWVCDSCAVSAGGIMPKGHLATWHFDHCGICGIWKFVTEPRDYGYPNLLLTLKSAQKKPRSRKKE